MPGLRGSVCSSPSREPPARLLPARFPPARFPSPRSPPGGSALRRPRWRPPGPPAAIPELRRAAPPPPAPRRPLPGPGRPPPPPSEHARCRGRPVPAGGERGERDGGDWGDAPHRSITPPTHIHTRIPAQKRRPGHHCAESSPAGDSLDGKSPSSHGGERGSAPLDPGADGSWGAAGRPRLPSARIGDGAQLGHCPERFWPGSIAGRKAGKRHRILPRLSPSMGSTVCKSQKTELGPLAAQV